MQKGIVVFVFANYLNDVLVWNYAMIGFKRGIEKAGMGSVPVYIHVLNYLKFRFLPKKCPREWRVGWRFFRAYAGLLVNATMIALLPCWRLKQNGNEWATPTTINHGQKAWSSLTTVGSNTTNWILLKLGTLQSLTWLATPIVPWA